MYGKAIIQTKTGCSPKCNIILLLKVIFMSFVLLLVYNQVTEVYYEKDLQQNMNALSQQDKLKELVEQDVLNMKLQMAEANNTNERITSKIANLGSKIPANSKYSSINDSTDPMYAKDTINDPSDPIYSKEIINDPSDPMYAKDTINNLSDPIYAKDTINIPSKSIHEEKKNEEKKSLKSLGTITMAQMVTEDKNYRYVNQTVVHIKSAMLFTDKPVKYFLFSYDHAPQMVVDQIHTWPEDIQKRLSIQTMVMSLDDIPSMGYGITEADIKTIKRVHHMKSHYLLQIMLMMTHLKYVILTDSDSIVISDITKTWQQFLHFNESQFAGMGPGGLRYKLKPNHTQSSNVYGAIGVNSGVLLLDLEKCRKSGIAQHMIQTLSHRLCKSCDQCLMMRYFVKYPQTMYYLPCSYNLHKGLDPCRFLSFRPYCEAIYSEGIYIYHGSASQYINAGSPYSILYRMIRNYDFDHDGIRYWEEVLKAYTKARAKCRDASAKTLKYFMQKAMLLK